MPDYTGCHAGMRRAKAHSRHLGRPRRHRIDADGLRERLDGGLSLRGVARALGVQHIIVKRALSPTTR